MIDFSTKQLSDFGTIASGYAALAVAILTCFLVFYNWRVVKEMEQDRLARFRPVILTNFDRGSQNSIVLRIRNFGGPAASVRFAFDPPLINSQGQDVGKMPLLANPMPLLLPNANHEVVFDYWNSLFSVDYYLGQENFIFNVTVDYVDAVSGKEYPAIQIVLNIDAIAPHGRPTTIRSAPLADRDWTHGARTSGDEALLLEILESLQQMGLTELALRARGWEVVADDHESRFDRVLLIKQIGTLQGVGVYASAWSHRAAMSLALWKAAEWDESLVN